MQEKQLLKKLGEETLYSAKGHFKSCDLRRQLITYTIWGCAIINILAVIGICPIVDKWLAALGLLGTIGLLIWNEGEGKNYRAKHKEIAEKYLALHKQIRTCFFLADCNKQQAENLSKAVIELDHSEKPEISTYARKWAKKSIESNDPETDNWFLND